MTSSPTPAEVLAMKTANAALLASPNASCDIVATIVFALGSAQLLQSPETAAEVEHLRARVAELEAAAKTSRIETIADVGDWLDENGQKDAAHLVYNVDIPAAREMRTVEVRPVDEDPIAPSPTVEALHASSGAVIEVPSGVNVCRSNVCGYCELPGHGSANCPDRAVAEAPHETPPRPRPVPHDLPEVTQ